MSLVTYKDLCIDVNDSRPASEFWAQTLGLELTGFDDDPDEFKLVGPTQQHTVWPNVVPEPHEVKNRVHLDVVAASLDSFEGLRRVSEPGRFPWTTLADPEDNEFCVFVVDEPADFKLKSIVVDCADPRAMADWWLGVLGGTLGSSDEHDAYWITDIPGMPFEGFDFVPVPAPKTVKNRVHWDVTLSPGVTIDDVMDTGATVLRRPDDEIRWAIMADPEGNEFCLFSS
ncbi:VOC family protein [Aeromicrobium sp.]|uniref:VOC family protein n=1 Tax=Aeromicrobium sp. TaxID=1871063 RepID=UPI003D6B898C